jgi:hypothetical protein
VWGEGLARSAVWGSRQHEAAVYALPGDCQSCTKEWLWEPWITTYDLLLYCLCRSVSWSCPLAPPILCC